MSGPLVSVCIGAYNRKDYIRECVDSALGQTWANREVIVVDDASTDGTREILESYGRDIRLILRDKNSGICPVTRNQAAQAARGGYVAFLDSDDKWYPQKLAKQVEFMEAHPDVPMCHTLCDVIDESSRVVGVRHGVGVVPPTGMIFERLLEHCWVTISTVLARRELFDEVGWFNSDPPYGYLGEDHEFFLRVSRNYPIGLVPEALAGFRKAGQGITAKNWRANPEPVPLFQAFLGRRDLWEGVVDRKRMVGALVDKCNGNAYFWRAERRWGRVAWFALQALRVQPFDVRAWKHLLAAGVLRGA
jgi:glycosyltransferase involved in cell wall biosynthesis